jgi:hypothetical protein
MFACEQRKLVAHVDHTDRRPPGDLGDEKQQCTVHVLYTGLIEWCMKNKNKLFVEMCDSVQTTCRNINPPRMPQNNFTTTFEIITDGSRMLFSVAR